MRLFDIYLSQELVRVCEIELYRIISHVLNKRKSRSGVREISYGYNVSLIETPLSPNSNLICIRSPVRRVFAVKVLEFCYVNLL